MSLVELRQGDSYKVLQGLDSASFDSLVTDPPSGTQFMGLTWDSDKGGRHAWIDWLTQIMQQCLRLLKPGAHGLIWAFPRTSHWTATALEDAGFEIRDMLNHVFGSGFPFGNLDLEKALKARGESGGKGQGTTLKPGHEVWWLVRKPLSEPTIIENFREHGTGALNIDGCRVAYKSGDTLEGRVTKGRKNGVIYGGPSLHRSKTRAARAGVPAHKLGRWPANQVLTNMEHQPWAAYFNSFVYCGKPNRAEKEAGLEALPFKRAQKLNEGGVQRRRDKKTEQQIKTAQVEDGGRALVLQDGTEVQVEDFVNGYRANHHPTVKSVELMRHFCRLVTPAGGRILDPFMGSGTTGCAAAFEGFDFYGIDLNQDYVDIARRRTTYWADRGRRPIDKKEPRDKDGKPLQGALF